VTRPCCVRQAGARRLQKRLHLHYQRPHAGRQVAGGNGCGGSAWGAPARAVRAGVGAAALGEHTCRHVAKSLPSFSACRLARGGGSSSSSSSLEAAPSASVGLAHVRGLAIAQRARAHQAAHGRAAVWSSQVPAGRGGSWLSGVQTDRQASAAVVVDAGVPRRAAGGPSCAERRAGRLPSRQLP
jgi:hypothetical protein